MKGWNSFLWLLLLMIAGLLMLEWAKIITCREDAGSYTIWAVVIAWIIRKDDKEHEKAR